MADGLETTSGNAELTTREITLNMGPQHPSTHGVMHLILHLQGEKIVKAEPDVGYLHRGMEKIAENLLYGQFVTYTDRLDYLSSMTNNLGYVSAVEKLLDLDIPERGKYIRVIVSELSRISSHLLAVGAWWLDLGAITMVLYAFREREMIMDLFEMLCGARLTYNYMKIGGLTGPSLRGSGVKWDIRKDNPYLVYDRFDFDVPVGTNGDCFDRYMCRVEEMRQAARIIAQALQQIPEGPVNANAPDIVAPPRQDVYNNMEALIHHFKIISHGFKTPK